MNCTQARQLFSPYLDGVVSGVQMQSLDRHMRQCVECHSQYNSLQQSAFATGIESINSDSLVIEAYVDSVGRVQDYRILSEPPESQQLLPQVKNMLIFTTFRPATNLGRPTAGRAVLSFSKISVRG